MKKLYMIGNTHFDPVWLWRWDEAMASIRATFRSALNRMNEDPNFIYSFATPPVFEWIKNVDPDMFEEIKMRIAEGRWELAEGWWVQPDCYSACGESYIRQGLYGQKYLLENFGKMSETVFNIDSFGHAPSFPQILRKSHINNYCFTRPEERHIKLDHQLINWKGLDGTTVKAYRAVGAYTKTLSEAIAQQEDKDADNLIVFGVTDHGGAPTKAHIAEINSMPDAGFSTVSKFFNDHPNPETTVEAELLTGDFGPYSNLSQIKKHNRTAEYALLNAEKASLLAGNENREKLSACWETVLFNQFHDILGGASIKEAYTDANNALGGATHTANEITHFALQKITSKIETVGKNPQDIWNLVIWNLNGKDFEGYLEAEVQWVHEFPWYEKGICLEDGNGNRIPCQIIPAKAVIPGFRSRFVFKAKIPALGYKVFKVVKTEEEPENKTLDPFEFETNRLKISFSKENGTLISVDSKETGAPLFKDVLNPVAYYDNGDTWAFNIEKYDCSPQSFQFESLTPIECGDLRTTVKADYRFRDSLLSMYYTFYCDEEYFDVKYKVNWNEKHYVFKLESKISADSTLSAVPYGIIGRAPTSADVPMSNYVAADGIEYLCDSIFSYNANANKLGLTVLRSPIYGDLRIRDIDYNDDYDIIAQGISEGNIRIARQNYYPEKIDALLNPPVMIVEANHGGNLPFEKSYISIKEGDACIGAVKKSEYGEGDIVRLFEYKGEKQKVELQYFDECFNTELSPFEIKTLKIEKGNITEYYMTEDSPL